MPLTHPHFFGLLHVQPEETTAMNLGGDFATQLSIYQANAMTLARSLALAGAPFTLLTNARSRLAELPSWLDVVEIPFPSAIPSGTSFYSAHYKIDVLRYFASLSSGYSILVDLDVVCINPLPPSLLHLVGLGLPIGYDVTDQVMPAHGRDRIIRDLSLILDAPSEGRWFGGEIIGGTPAFFQALTEKIEHVLPAYINNLSELHHTSDEAIVTPALESLRSQGISVSDVGTLGIISRFWSCPVLHPQKPYAWSRSCCLLHLPADKALLAHARHWSDQELRAFSASFERLLTERSSFQHRLKGKLQRLVSKVLWRRP
jgi:hypothetical protein